jgi:PKD repeat protein
MAKRALRQVVVLTYENPGTYTATVTATDSIGNTASDRVSIELVPPTTATEEEQTNNTLREPPAARTDEEAEEQTAEEPITNQTEGQQ